MKSLPVCNSVLRISMCAFTGAAILVVLMLMVPQIQAAESGNQPDQQGNKYEWARLEQATVTSSQAKATGVKAYHVDGKVSRSGNGSVGSPFKTIQEGVDAAHPGDFVWVAAGEYDEFVQTARDGEAGRPVTIRSNPPIEAPHGAAPGWTPADESQRVWIRREGRSISVDHSHIVIDGINVDGMWWGLGFIDDEGIFRDTTRTGVTVTGANGIVRVNQEASYIMLRNMEVKNNQSHIVRIHGENVVIDNARIHRAISRTNNTPVPEPGLVTMNDSFRDAHGIEASHARKFSIINTYIGYVSGDCVQLGRSVWGDFLVENSHFEMEPLKEPILGLKVGTWFGEDHFDTKTPDWGRTGSKFNKGIIFRNSIFNGTKYSRIENGAVLNTKEGVEDIVFENNIVYDNRITFRLRRPTRGYRIRNNVFFNNENVVWFEGRDRDDSGEHESPYLNDVQVVNNTFYNNEIAVQETAGGGKDALIAANIFSHGPNKFLQDGPSNIWKHNLYYRVSSEMEKTADATSLKSDPQFVNPANEDFRLRPGSPALLSGIGARPDHGHLRLNAVTVR